MFAATAAGLFPRVEAAMAAMGPGFDAEYQPDPDRVPYYESRYRQYNELGGFLEAQAHQNALLPQLST